MYYLYFDLIKFCFTFKFKLIRQKILIKIKNGVLSFSINCQGCRILGSIEFSTLIVTIYDRIYIRVLQVVEDRN